MILPQNIRFKVKSIVPLDNIISCSYLSRCDSSEREQMIMFKLFNTEFLSRLSQALWLTGSGTVKKSEWDIQQRDAVNKYDSFIQRNLWIINNTFTK